MCNREILEKIIEEFGAEKATQFCEIAALMYDIKYNAAKELDPLNEFDFERVWWLETFIEMNKELEID